MGHRAKPAVKRSVFNLAKKLLGSIGAEIIVYGPISRSGDISCLAVSVGRSVDPSVRRIVASHVIDHVSLSRLMTDNDPAVRRVVAKRVLEHQHS